MQNTILPENVCFRIGGNNITDFKKTFDDLHTFILCIRKNKTNICYWIGITFIYSKKINILKNILLFVTEYIKNRVSRCYGLITGSKDRALFQNERNR